MAKLVALGFLASMIAAASPAGAADGPKGQTIPDFAPNEKTSWVLDRDMGVDDMLPPPAVARVP